MNSLKETSNRYGYWQSNLSLEKVFSEQSSFSYPTLYQQYCFYLTSLPEQKGRTVLMRQELGNEGPVGVAECLTPKPFSLRTKINEYGGKPYWLANNSIYFSNQSDQHLYRQALDGSSVPVRVSPELASGRLAMYTDVHCIKQSSLLAIVEIADRSGSQNSMCLAQFMYGNGHSQLNKLVEGADFYSNLVINPEQTQVAWVQWQHPAMPWDDTQLWVADIVFIDGVISFENQRRIAFPGTVSVCQLAFAGNGLLYFSVDFAEPHQVTEQFWNVHYIDPQQKDCRPIRVTDKQQEFGYPHWQYGDHRIACLDSQRMLVIGSEPTHDTLYSIDIETQAVTVCSLDEAYCALQGLTTNERGQVALIAMAFDKPPCLLRLSLQSSTVKQIYPLKQSNVAVSTGDVSIAQHICFKTRDGEQAYGFYYAPKNSAYQSQPNTSPPLIVLVHGGPTARSYGYFDIQKQFWTSRGFALFDVNHRGSSGYGRVFRDALYGEWGMSDASDIVDGVEYLIEQGLANPEQICIRGKSAGGYAVLRALTEYPDVFKAGACYYGIGNLVTLAEHTHKFEKYYTDRLIGEAFDLQQVYDPQSLFVQRSPINAMHNVRSAMILFQGLDDKIVPPCVSREVVDVLKANNVPYQYIEYQDEGHGFRQAKTNIDAWSKELAFYQEGLNEHH